MIFQHGLILVINKPTRVTKKSASAIDHIITNSFLTNEIKTGIIKTDVSDHFPIFLICDKFNFDGCPVNNFIFKRYINDTSLQHFENSLNSINWYKIQKINCPNEAYDEFIKTFSSCYEVSFPKVKIKIKSKSFLSPWITKGLIKSSKKKQKLYNNFLKHKTYKNEKKYKTYKNLFETLKLKSKKNYYAKLINKYKNNIKKTWQVIKEIIGKTKLISNNLPRRLIVNETEISDQKDIAKHFNEYFINVGPNLASNIPDTGQDFKSYLTENTLIQEESILTDEEFEKAFFSLKTNKSPGYDDINFNVIKHIYGTICTPLKHIFQQSLSKGIFPDALKIARVTITFQQVISYIFIF